jgi:hypothetical protein
MFQVIFAPIGVRAIPHFLASTASLASTKVAGRLIDGADRGIGDATMMHGTVSEARSLILVADNRSGAGALGRLKELSSCRNHAEIVVFEVRHQECLKDLVLAQDLGALCGVVVEGLALRGYLLLLLFGGEVGGIGGSRTSAGRGEGAARRRDAFATNRRERTARHSVIDWMNFLVMESSVFRCFATG